MAEDKFIPYGLQDVNEEDINEVVQTLKSNWITTGPKITEFEQEFAKYIGCRNSVAVCNGTAALDLAVASLGLKKGAEIITTPFTFVATANSIIYNECAPVFADIKKDTFNIDPSQIRKRITKKTKAIIVVDYAGQPCGYDEIIEIAKKNNLYLIEDAAHSLGAEYKGKKTGNVVDLAIFSFHPVKHITTGEGGMITTNNDEFARKLRMLRNHGIDKNVLKQNSSVGTWHYDMKLLGRNYRMTDFQAALGISQMKRLDGFVRKRQQLVEIYNSELKRIPEITTPFVSNDVKHSWHLYTVLLDKEIDREKVFLRMKEKKIGVNVHYIPVYKHTYYRQKFNFSDKDFPNAEEVYSRIMTLPLFPKMSKEDVFRVVGALKEAIKEAGNKTNQESRI